MPLRYKYWVLLVAAPLYFLLAASPVFADSVDLTLVLAVDVSDSIDATEGKLQRQGYADAFQRPEIQKAIKSGPHRRIAVAYFEWADVAEQELIIDWMIIDDVASAKVFGERLKAAAPNGGHFTSISAAITYGLNLLRNAPFQTERKVIDISGDGRSNDGPPMEAARQAANIWDVTINGLPIDNERSRLASDMIPGQIAWYYREKVITGPGAFIVEAKNFADFEHAISRKLLREIANAEPPGDKKNALRAQETAAR